MNPMTQAYDLAIESSRANTEKSGYLRGGYGIAQSPVGEVRCILIQAQGVTTFLPRHFRKTWQLNGKVISAAKLEKTLAAA